MAADRVVRAEVSRSERRCGRRRTPSAPGVSPDASGPNGTGTRHRLPPALCETRTPALPRQCAHSSRPASCLPADHTKSMAAVAAAAAASGVRTEWWPVRRHTCCSTKRIGGRRCLGTGRSEQCSHSRRFGGCCTDCSPSMAAGAQCCHRRPRGIATSAMPIVGPRPRAARDEATAASRRSLRASTAGAAQGRRVRFVNAGHVA